MSGHTKGPLTIHGPSKGGTSTDDGGDYAIRDARRFIIGEAIFKVGIGESRQARANATLWAAAPEMLEALSDLLISHDNVDWDFHWRTDESAALLDRACAALAKARGES